MARVVIHTMQFFLGVIGTLCIGFYIENAGYKTGATKAYATQKTNTVDKPASEVKNDSNIVRTRLVEPQGIVPVEVLLVEENFPKLIKGIEAPKSEFGKLLSKKELSLLPETEYNSQVWPFVKEYALKILVEKFEERDWNEWPKSAFEPKNNSSSARNYVRDVYEVNPELGAFLDASALFFYRLANSVADAKSYHLRKDKLSDKELEAFLEFAKEYSGFETSNLISKISLDPSFLRIFERVRCGLTSSLLDDSKSSKPLENYKLLDDVKPYLCSQNAVKKFAEFLRYFIVNQTQEQLFDILSDENFEGLLIKLAANNEEIRTLGVQLYVISALQLLELGEIDLAELLYIRSLELNPGINSHYLVSPVFEEIVLKKQATSSVKKTKKVAKTKKAGRKRTAKPKAAKQVDKKESATKKSDDKVESNRGSIFN